MTNIEYVTSLRNIADFLEAHPDFPLPAQFEKLHIFVDGKKEMALAAKAFGNCEKDVDDTFFMVRKDFGGVTLEVNSYRQNVCRRVVIGTKLVPASIVPAGEAKIIPEHMEDIVEWRCPDSLLEAGQ